MSTADASSTTIVERVQNFVSEHKKAILVGAAVAVAVGGVAYYASSSSPKKRKPKSKKSRKQQDEESSKAGDSPSTKARVEPDFDEEAFATILENKKSYSEEELRTMANTHKTEGNDLYKEHKLKDAIACYTRAIKLSPNSDPVFYSNRAACYISLQKPEYEKAADDCSNALRIDKMHVRSLRRRGTAYEKLGKLKESIKDLIAVRFITGKEEMQLDSEIQTILHRIVMTDIADVLKDRKQRLPPDSFIDAYFGAFRKKPRPTMPEEPSTGDNTLTLAMDAFDARDYTHSFTLVNEALQQDISVDEAKAFAFNLRGSFKFLCNDSEDAAEDLQAATALVPSHTQSFVKIASIYMELMRMPDAWKAFEDAIQINPDDPDIYYHRGQVRFILENYGEAAEDYQKSMDLDQSFVFSFIQLAVAHYKNGRASNAMATFRKAVKQFPLRSEPQNYYGELLLDQRRFEDAVEKFDRAIELEKAKGPPINVLAMVNKALTFHQWKEDTRKAEAITREALTYDSDCEAAVATLAQIDLQYGNFAEAAELFQKQARLARSEQEVAVALQFATGAIAHDEFLKDYPELRHRLQGPGAGMFTGA